MDSRFREIRVRQAWPVYLATGFDFREKRIVPLLGRSEPDADRQIPTLPLYCEGKVKIILPQNLVYILRTTATHHMVSFIDFYFHFVTNFQT